MLPEEKRIKSKADLNEFLAADLVHYRPHPLKYFLRYGESSLLKRHQILLRKTEFYLNTGKKLREFIFKFRLIKFQTRYGIHIPLNCCGKGLHIMHLAPISVNRKATLGENVSLHACTQIVAGGSNNLVPTIGNNVIVGVGAVVLGGVTIADNIAIGANSVVNKSFVEPSITIAGVPAKKISDHGTEVWKKEAEPTQVLEKRSNEQGV